MTITEDEMVASLIEKSKDPFDPHDRIELTISPEEHYNYYGDRGVVDLFVREREPLGDGRNGIYDELYEVKSTNAVKSATGANEILRQFNRMREYFYQDESRVIPTDTHIELLFVAEPAVVEHVYENSELYLQAKDRNLCKYSDKTFGERIFFRHPEDNIPVQLEYKDFQIGDAEYASFVRELDGKAATVVAKTLS